MKIYDIFKVIHEEIHATVFATVDEKGLPVTSVIDIMDADDSGLYFLTARGKNFYKRLENTGFVSLSGIKGEGTMSSVAVSVRGHIVNLGTDLIEDLFEKNPYMKTIYPTKESAKALDVFKIYKGEVEYFDLRKKPIERYSMSFGDAKVSESGYFIKNECTGCGNCLTVCPQNCINSSNVPFEISQKNCLHCGNCFGICSFNAIEKRG